MELKKCRKQYWFWREKKKKTENIANFISLSPVPIFMALSYYLMYIGRISILISLIIGVLVPFIIGIILAIIYLIFKEPVFEAYEKSQKLYFEMRGF